MLFEFWFSNLLAAKLLNVKLKNYFYIITTTKHVNSRTNDITITIDELFLKAFSWKRINLYWQQSFDDDIRYQNMYNANVKVINLNETILNNERYTRKLRIKSHFNLSLDS